MAGGIAGYSPWMFEVVLAGVGWLLVALTGLDVFRTVVWSSQGAGPVTSVVTALIGRASEVAAGSRLLRSLAGPVALFTVVAVWAGLLLVGFTLALQVDSESIRATTTGAAADWSERIYYVGYTLFTLGNGDFAPNSSFTQAVTVMTNLTGMFLITLSVTYFLPVISASVGSRSFASSAVALGERPADVIIDGWDGERVDLDDQLRDLAGQLSILGQQHLAYPVLHLFHAPRRGESAPLAVGLLDDVLTLLDAVDPMAASARPSRRQLRSSIVRYVDAHGHDANGSAKALPLTLDELRAADIRLQMDDQAFESLLDEMEMPRGEVACVADLDGIGA